MDSLNIDNCSKTLAFKKFKRLLYKYYPKFLKNFEKHKKFFFFYMIVFQTRKIIVALTDF